MRVEINSSLYLTIEPDEIQNEALERISFYNYYKGRLNKYETPFTRLIAIIISLKIEYNLPFAKRRF